MNSQYQHAYCQVSGTPFEQGVQQGQELSDAIRRNLASVHRKLEQEKVDLQAYQAFVNQNLRFFQEQRPEMYEELQGIAQGSGLPLDDILLLNIPAYFLCESFRHITQECSMLCVRGQAAADGCTYIIKNRDMGMPMEQALVRHIYPDGQEIIEVGGAGILTYPAVGINSHGLAVTTTGFWTEKDPTRIDRVEEADIFLNVRVLLSSCRTAAQAVEFCRTAPRMNGLNVIAADPTEDEALRASLCPAPGDYRDFEVFHGYVEQYTWRTDPKIYIMNCPECGAPLTPDDVWLKKGSNSWYTLSQCPRCAGSGSAAGKGVFQRYKLARRDGLHWSYARCLQMPDDASLDRWEKQRTAQLERMKARAEKPAAE